jgi:outer membrane protein assembly factor BamB
VASFSAGVYALDATGGGERWRLADLERVSSLSTDGRYLYAASSATGLIKLDPESGTVIWARDLGSRAIVGAVSVTPTLLAVPTGDRSLWLVRSSDGEPVEGIMSGYGYSSVPAMAGSRMFVASNAGVLSAFRVTNRGALATW